MGRTDVSTRVERPIYEAWIGASRRLYDYVLWLEDRVKRLEDERVYSAQLQADELRRRDRVITEKDLELSRLEQENCLLRERLRLSSRTSSKSPSAPQRTRSSHPWMKSRYLRLVTINYVH